MMTPKESQSIACKHTEKSWAK